MRALILVDIQNDFLPGGALAVPCGDEVVQVANRLMPFYPLVVATQDWHPADHSSFASKHPGRSIGEAAEVAGIDQILWPDHCVQGTVGADFAPNLNTADIDHVVPKGTHRMIDSYSGFFDNEHRHATGLGDYLMQRGVTEVDVMGLATDYCVKFTALDAVQLGFKVRLIVDGVRGVELSQGDCDRAMDQMQAAGVLLTHSGSIGDREIQTLHQGRHLSMLTNGTWEYATRNVARPAVGIVAITPNGNVVLVEQYRPAIARKIIELPAGLAGDIAGSEDEALLEAAKRELLEETGYTAARWTEMIHGYSSPGLTDESITLFLAQDLTRRGEGGGEQDENIRVHEVPLSEVLQWLRQRNAPADLKLLAGLHAASEYQQTEL